MLRNWPKLHFLPRHISKRDSCFQWKLFESRDMSACQTHVWSAAQGRKSFSLYRSFLVRRGAELGMLCQTLCSVILMWTIWVLFSDQHRIRRLVLYVQVKTKLRNTLFHDIIKRKNRNSALGNEAFLVAFSTLMVLLTFSSLKALVPLLCNCVLWTAWAAWFPEFLILCSTEKKENTGLQQHEASSVCSLYNL